MPSLLKRNFLTLPSFQTFMVHRSTTSPKETRKHKEDVEAKWQTLASARSFRPSSSLVRRIGGGVSSTVSTLVLQITATIKGGCSTMQPLVHGTPSQKKRKLPYLKNWEFRLINKMSFLFRQELLCSILNLVN